jgi:hypothetical protein
MECLECAIDKPVSAAADMIGRREGLRFRMVDKAWRHRSHPPRRRRIIPALYQAFHPWTSASSVESLPSFRPSGTKASFRSLTQMRGCGACPPCQTAIHAGSHVHACGRLPGRLGPTMHMHAFNRTHLNFASFVSLADVASRP